MPMGNEFKELLKKRGGHIFKSCDISLKNTPTVILALLVRSDSAMSCYHCACSVCLHLSVPLLAQCCFFRASCLT